MPFLDASLAFALTMLVIASAVTMIVRLIQACLKVRSAVLRDMLVDFFDTEIKPTMDLELKRLAKKPTQAALNKLSKLAEDTSLANVFNDEELKKLTEISTEEFKLRLLRSQLGSELLDKLGEQTKPVLDELGKRYDAVGVKFSESFRSKSRYYSTAVALVLALVVNIDSLYIVNAYMTNANLREGIIANMDYIVSDYDNRVAPSPPNPFPATAPQPDDSDTPKNQSKSEVEQEIRSATRDAKLQLNLLRNSGFPIGWSFFPHAGLSCEPSADWNNRNYFGGWIMWIFGVLLTAGLAGLGSPFWYDAVIGIARIAQRKRTDTNPPASNQQTGENSGKPGG